MSTKILKNIEAEAKKYLLEHPVIAHGFDHVQRVQELCRLVGKSEKANILVLEVAAILHDIGRKHEVDDPEIDHAEKSAEISAEILKKVKFSNELTSQVLYAIKMHRFRKMGLAKTLEAKILQDADKIDAGGAIGIAKMFAYYGGYQKIDLYHIDDPFAEKRDLDDKRFVLDHFYTKLLKLADLMNTKTGKELATKRRAFMKLFLRQLRDEIEGRK